MRVHVLECGCMRPFGGRLWDGATPGLGAAHLACRCLLLESEAGLVLVDTGFGLGDVNRPTPRLSRTFLYADRPSLQADETAVSRIRALGLDPADVRHVVMTHLDFDHAGGIADFPRATVHVHAAEVAAFRARRGPIGRARWRPLQLGAPLRAYDAATGDWFGLPAVDALDGLPPGIRLVSLPGHTPGHCGVAVDTGRGWLLHAGDAIFMHAELEAVPRCPPLARAYQRLMETNRPARLASRERLRRLARERAAEVTVLCTHDPLLPDAVTRLVAATAPRAEALPAGRVRGARLTLGPRRA